MGKMTTLSIFAFLLCLAACTSVGGVPPPLGEPIDAVKARLGQPTAVYPVPVGQQLEYRMGPMGQKTFMAHFGADGRLASYEQVLTSQKFATLKTGVASPEDALHTVGQPAERTTLPHLQRDVWSYRYKENGVWNSMMYLQFDHAGVLREMFNGPDPMYGEHDRGIR